MFDGDYGTMSIQIDERKFKKLNINDKHLMSAVFSSEELEIYRKVRGFMNGVGFQLEDYLDWKSQSNPNIRFVGRDRNRPKQTDFIIDGEGWSIKNSEYGENSTTKDYREDYVGVVNHWFRIGRDGNYRWGSCPIPGCSEEEFEKFLGVDSEDLFTTSLCRFF